MKLGLKKLSIMLACMLMLSACQKKPEPEVKVDKAQEKLESMTLEEKAAQLFIVTPEQFVNYNQVTQAGETTQNAIKEIPVGGFIYLEPNLVDPEQTRQMSANIQKYSQDRIGLPAWIAVDEEGGMVARVANHGSFDVKDYPNMWNITRTEDNANEVGSVIGEYLKDLGFNLDFAPVADVRSNAKNQVIGERSFSDDPEEAAMLAKAVLNGLQSQGVYGTLKHYPGHGATDGDSHLGYAYTSKSLEEMKQCELVPFEQGIASGEVSFIMAGHIAVPEITGNDEPASISHHMIHDILRDEMGYDGIVITDAMNMGAITEQYSSAEAAVKALQAGVDIVLMPLDFKAAYEGVLQAVESGELSEERIDEAVKRIIEAKLKL